jgi:acyl-CoA synthetase (AMP-forming)/AMP-acid ligase II
MYTLGDIPRKGALLFRDNTALVYEGSRYTYGELNERVNRFANALIALGFGKGDKIAIMADNCSKYVEAYFAAAKLGICVTPVNVRLANDEIAYIVSHCEATVFIVGDSYEDRAAGFRQTALNVKTWISFDNPVAGFLEYDAILNNASKTEPAHIQFSVNEEDLAIIMYTGGTTGLPKGVMLSHRSVMISAISPTFGLGITQHDSTCFVLPIFHVSWWPILMMLLIGGKVCINRRPDLDLIFKLIQEEKCTHLNMVPTIYGFMVDYPGVENYDLSSLKYLTYAGSPFPVEVLKRCIKKFGNKFYQGYGATETAGAGITALDVRDHHLEGEKTKYLYSAGKPAFCSEVRIVDEEDQEVKSGEIGEICARGRHIMIGYWKNPELTEVALRGDWYHTGDMGYFDESGYIYMTDRKADMIISGGENVYPKEVEDVLYEHQAVRECTVVSAPDEKWGETVHAVVVLHSGIKVSEAELIEHCKQKLAGYKCPRAVSFWDSLPKSIIGKIVKKAVKETFWKGRERHIG